MDLTALKKEARHKATSATRLLELAKMDPQLSRAIAKRAAPLPAEVFEALARHSDIQTQRTIAAHPKVPVQWLEYLSGHGQWTVLKAVVQNSNTPGDMLDKLSRHKRNTVRNAVAQRNGLPEEMIERLCTDPDPLVRQTMVRHLQTTAEQLERFFTDPHPSVRQTLAGFTRPRVFANDLLKDSNPQVRCAASAYAEYSALKPLLSHLASDPEESVRLQIARRCKQPELLVGLTSDSSEEVRTQVAHNPFTPDEVLFSLAKGATHPIQHALCCNPFTPAPILQRLAEVVPLVPTLPYKTYPYWALTENPSTPPEALRLLRQRSLPHFYIPNRRDQNPNWPADLVIELAYPSAHATANHNKDPQIQADFQEFTRIKDQLPPEEVLAWMLGCSIYELNDAAASNRHTPGEAVARFVQRVVDPEGFWYTLEMIAKNPATPLEVLQRMVTTHAYHLLKNPFLPDGIIHTLAQQDAKGGATWWHFYLRKSKGLLEARQARGIQVDDHGNISRPNHPNISVQLDLVNEPIA